MRYVIAGTAVAVIAVGSLVAFWPGSTVNPAACKSAMAAAYLTTMRDPSAPPAAEPVSCHGVPTATVSQFAAQIMGGQH